MHSFIGPGVRKNRLEPLDGDQHAELEKPLRHDEIDGPLAVPYDDVAGVRDRLSTGLLADRTASPLEQHTQKGAVVAGKLGTPPYRPRGLAAEAHRADFAAPLKGNPNRSGDVRIVTDVPVQHPGVQGGADRLAISVEG